MTNSGSRAQRHADRRHRAVERPALALGRQHAEQDADWHQEDEAGAGQDQRAAQPFQHQRQDRHVEAQRAPPVAGHEPAGPAQVTDHHRLVVAELGVERVDRVLGGEGTEDDPADIARHDRRQQEDEDRRHPQGEQQEGQAAQQERGHRLGSRGATPRRRPQRGKPRPPRHLPVTPRLDRGVQGSRATPAESATLGPAVEPRDDIGVADALRLTSGLASALTRSPSQTRCALVRSRNCEMLPGTPATRFDTGRRLLVK